jgi:Xaa-Pro aminopeptidase
VAVQVVNDLWTMRRRLKRQDEVAAMRAAQRANERAVGAGVRLIAEAEVRGADLYWEGEPLTADRVRAAIQVAGIADGMTTPDGCIVAPGLQASDPHESGHGPLHVGDPIIIDSYPQHATNRYWADMTRTVVRGTPSRELQDLYDDILAAQELALAELRPGVDGRDVWVKVCEFLHGRGHPTQLESPTTSEGFMHGLGHGLGLEVHEKPRLNQESVVLQPGDVVTVEPGLYYPKLGAARIEDVAVITEHGFENLTHFSKAFVLD